MYIKERDKQLRENSKKGIKGRKQLNIELNKLNIINNNSYFFLFKFIFYLN